VRLGNPSALCGVVVPALPLRVLRLQDQEVKDRVGELLGVRSGGIQQDHIPRLV
jgi:hypothetical protein